MDSYWTVAEDVAASRLANVGGLREIEVEHGDDAYGETDNWAETVLDFGENT